MKKHTKKLTLRGFHIEDDVDFISGVLIDLDCWLYEDKDIFVDESIDENWPKNLLKDCNGNGYSYYSKKLSWKQEVGGETVECEIRIDVCSDHQHAKEILEKSTGDLEYDVFLLDVYGQESKVMHIKSNAKVVSGFIIDPQNDVRIVTSYQEELKTYLEQTKTDPSNETKKGGIPTEWDWPNSTVELHDILCLKDNPINLYRWLYKRLLEKIELTQ